MISKRFPWKIFWMSLLAQLSVFHVIYGIMFLFHGLSWDNKIVWLAATSSLISTFIFIRPVHMLVISLKDQKAKLHREREENQAFLSSIQEAVVSFSLKQEILFFNPQFATLFIGTEKNARERSFSQVFSQPELHRAVEHVVQKGTTQKVTLRIPTLVDAVPRFFNISLAPVRMMKNQELYEITAVFHDITDIKKAEQIRIDFVGNASHELRTPLTSIKGYVETLQDDIKSNRFDQADKFISIVSRNVDRLIALVNDLLNISKMESGASELNLQKLSPMQITQAVIGDVALLAQEKNIVIKTTCNASVLEADGQKVEQVLRNLISNAIKYIPEGKEIQILWEASSTETVLRVADNGPGIPEEHHVRIFERFYRIDRGRTREAGGTGLGLAIAKHIMQSHGGSIEIRSHLGQGAEFICRFPQNLPAA